MKILGAHMSIAGGVDRAVDRGAMAGCEAIQIFTKSSNQWAARPIDPDEIGRFRGGLREKGIGHVVAHDCYLVNLASPDDVLYEKSVEAFGVEIDRCAALGIPFLVAHPGSHVGAGLDAGIDRIAGALNRLLGARPRGSVTVLLETTAGQGSSIGHRFDHLARIIDRIEDPDRVGVCLDTCHVFAAGYDIRSRKGYESTMRDLDREVGLGKVRAVHLNDSKKDLGCRVDRHEHIGKGCLGLDAFRWLMNDERFDGVPMVLETPKGPDCAEDRVNLALLRGLEGGKRRRAAR